MNQATPEAAVAAKSIILFSDGTGNSSAKLFKTNVWRLYEAADLGPSEPGEQRQIASYDNGVGTSSFRFLQMLQGVFGWGLQRNVLELYSYACRNYDPASAPLPSSGIAARGDHIYGFGFSRGAFTMRLVIGLIADQGLVPYTNEQDLAWKVREVYRDFRRGCSRRSYRWLRGLLAAKPAAAPAAPGIRKRGKSEYDPAENHRPVIRFMGVWDTVAAYGGPIAEITRAIDTWIYPLSMPNYELSEKVLCARHALALDDERDSFWPLVWDEVHEQKLIEAGTVAPDRLQQVWFTGMHADVGGGYPDESLSYVSLLWMMQEAGKCGLRTLDEITDRYQALANSLGPVHDSRAGLAGYYRYQPRKLAAWLHPVTARTLGYRDPSIRAGKKAKGLLTRVVVHQSVINRIASGTDGYAPIVLPAAFDILPPEGHLIETAPQATSGGDAPVPKAATAAAEAPLQEGAAPDGDGPTVAKAKVAEAMERVWDLVWYRRAAYFATVAATVTLFAWPWLQENDIQRWVEAQNSAAGLQLLIGTIGDALGNLIRWVGAFLPAFTNRWFDAWAGSPWSFAINVFFIWAFRSLGAGWGRRISDNARAIWHGVLPRIPPASAAARPAGVALHKPGPIQRLRNSYAYQRTIQFLKWAILPNVVGVVMLAALVWLGLAVATQGLMPFREAGTAFCGRVEVAEKSGAASAAGPVLARFDTRALCNTTGAQVIAGEEYTIVFDVTEEWRDSSYEASPQGLSAGGMRWLAGYVGAPFRRVMNARYLQPVALIRSRVDGDSTVQVLPLDLAPVPDEANRFAGTFTAPADGELALFANDAVGLLDLDLYYENNQGTAAVTISPAGAVPGKPRREPGGK